MHKPLTSLLGLIVLVYYDKLAYSKVLIYNWTDFLTTQTLNSKLCHQNMNGGVYLKCLN